jgi:hypothetical protein
MLPKGERQRSNQEVLSVERVEELGGRGRWRRLSGHSRGAVEMGAENKSKVNGQGKITIETIT